MSLLKSLVLVSIFGIAGALVFFSVFPDYSPQASLDLQLTRDEIIANARAYLQEIGYDVEGLEADANLRFDTGVALSLEAEKGLAEAHKILRADSLPSYYWDIYFYDSSLPPSQMPNQYYLCISPTGHVSCFTRRLDDTVAVASLQETEARTLAESFLKDQGIDLNRFTLERSSVEQLVNRKDHSFKWTRSDSVFGMASKIWLKVQGDRVGGFQLSLQEPESFRQASSDIQTTVNFIFTAAAIATFFLLIFVIPLFLKKFVDGEVGIKTAWVVFAVLFGAILIEHLLAFTTIGYGMGLGDVNRTNVRLVIFFILVFVIQFFLAAMALAAWSVGESSARRGWSRKLSAIDGLLHGKVFTLDMASAIVRGYAFGFIILGAIYGMLFVASSFTHIGIFTSPLLNRIPDSLSPSLSALFLAFRTALLNEIVFRFFFVSWLREKTGKMWPGILISSLIWTLVAFVLWDFPPGFVQFAWLFPAYFLLSVALSLILVKFDLMTAILADFVALAFAYAIPILVSSAPFFETHGVIFYSLMAVPLVIAGGGFIRREQFQFKLELTPAHIRRISERERMAKELEIARSVQMSLLPRENPHVEGYDIAGICIPALEVGGDYYDFFNLANQKFGIAIGDVSGKGVPAAIYMTLTKGILQSYAGESASPKEVLTKLNRQMYLSIERNSFVSMFYAVLDMKKHTIQFARAGHNPAILAQPGDGRNRLLQPKGIALGLESGEKFYHFLEEHQLQLHSQDVLAFYTDGFTEASTSKGEEYGEERLLEVVSQGKHESASAIIRRVVDSVREFVGSHPQHDDMTMVVMKAR